ncbi:hypothetical protein EMCG_05591 [[Emmonsia] crescens]|uniref:Uncharacterized protein n=1 Tax=[Emmonsia] crescens TaxID=73230 RepID=A0A0G2JC92_9EURO|nr:hypothetical protein EMCG_05591 [Emmonsia crescens UAMH 3008]
MESPEGALPQASSLADLYSALIRTRQNFEQNITNMEETIRRSRDTEKIDDIQKYLPTLFLAFHRLDSLFEKLSGFKWCALGMDVEEQELMCPKQGTITRRTTDPSGITTCHLLVVEHMIREVEQFKAIKKLLEKIQDQFYEQISEQDATKVRDAYLTLEDAQDLVVNARIAKESYMEEEEEVLGELLAADDVSSTIYM